MHSWNIFLIEALSMLASPRIKTVKPPDKKPGTCSDRPSFLHRRIVKFQFVWQKQCYNIPLARLLQKHVGLLDSFAKYQKSFVSLRKMCLMVVLLFIMETTTCHRLNNHYNFVVDRWWRWIKIWNTKKNSLPLTFLSIDIVLISHVIYHMTILRKVVNFWPIGGRFKKRNRAITFSYSY